MSWKNWESMRDEVSDASGASGNSEITRDTVEQIMHLMLDRGIIIESGDGCTYDWSNDEDGQPNYCEDDFWECVNDAVDMMSTKKEVPHA